MKIKEINCAIRIYNEKWIEDEIREGNSKWIELTEEELKYAIETPIKGEEYRVDFDTKNTFEMFFMCTVMRGLSMCDCRVFVSNGHYYVSSVMTADQLAMQIGVLMKKIDINHIEQLTQAYEQENM